MLQQFYHIYLMLICQRLPAHCLYRFSFTHFNHQLGLVASTLVEMGGQDNQGPVAKVCLMLPSGLNKIVDLSY